MNHANLSQYIGFIGLTGFLIIMAYFFVHYQKVKREQRKALGRETLPSFDARFNTIAQRSYNLFLRVPGLKHLVIRVRKRIETLSVYDEYTLRREVMKIIFIVLSVIILILILLSIIRPSWLVAFWILLGLLFLTGVLIDFFVYRVEERLLQQLKEFNNRIRFFYHQTRMVEDAIYESMQFVGPEMKTHADRIYNILNAVEPRKELTKYEEVAPTRYLKVVAGLSLQVKEQGDQITEKGSTFLNALSAVNEELNNEILYRSKLAHRLKFISTLTLVPIFFALPAKNWAISNFTIMQNFYDSRIGFLAEVLGYTVSVVCYLISRKLQEVTESKNPMRVKKVFWEEWLFQKIPFVEEIAKVLSPTPYTKRRFKLEKLLNDANSPNSVEVITLHRILIGFAVFVLLTGGFVYSHVREVNGVMNNNVALSFFTGPPSQEELEAANALTEFDKDVIRRLQESKANLTEEQLKNYVAATMGLQPNDPEVIAAYDRIVYKWSIVQNAYFKWYELIFIIGIAYIVSFSPIWNLQFKRHLRYKEMESEVHQQLILISSLREFDRMTVYMILDWMERFSFTFKEPLQVCLQDFDSGPIDALDRLMYDVAFEPFQQIVERLKLAIERISIKQAFDDIEMERAFYLEQRKEAQYRSLVSKNDWGQLLGFLPSVFLILIYLAIPLLYMAVVKSQDTMNYLS